MSIPIPFLVTLEACIHNEDGYSLTLHYNIPVTADQVKEYIRTKRKDHSSIDVWVSVDDPFFELEEIRPGVWQANPAC